MAAQTGTTTLSRMRWKSLLQSGFSAWGDGVKLGLVYAASPGDQHSSGADTHCHRGARMRLVNHARIAFSGASNAPIGPTAATQLRPAAFA